MPIKLDGYLAKLPAKRRKAIATRTKELIEEEATLRQLRELYAKSQEEIAKSLGVNQAAVSKLERRTDMHVSSLRKWIEALGGELEIVATFPGKHPVRVTQFKELTGA